MLRVVGLAKSFGARVLFDGVTFAVNRGERIGLVGRNGDGKTTLLRILMGEERPDAGEVSVPRGYRIGHLSQILSFTRPSALAEAALGLPEAQRDDLWKVKKVLAGLGFPPGRWDLPPERLSGGFQVRLNLAKVLVSEPDLLLLDEPTNFLDLPAVRWLTRFLQGWRGELLLVTHDRAFMDGVTTHTMGLHRERLRKMPGTTEKYYAQLARDEEVAERSRANEEKKRRDTELFIRRFRAKARLAGLVQSRIKQLAKLEPGERPAARADLEFSFRAAPFEARTLLTAEDLSFSWEGKEPYLFAGFSLALHPGDRVAVVGANGRGKSTLLRLLAGELSPSAGKVRPHRLLRAGFYGQTNVERLEDARTVVEEILASDPERSPQRARDTAGAMMFEGDDAGKRISVLSGGERSRVLLGKLLLSPVNLLLLDEPTNHLDMESCESLLEALEEFPGAVVIVTHEEEFLHRLAGRLVVFDRGKVSLFEGSYQRFLEEVGWQSEDEMRTEAGTTPPGGGGDRRRARRERAALIQERSRVLRPLERRVADLEDAVRRAEAGLAANEEGLARASTASDAGRIAELGKRNPALRTELERLYRDLWAATEELEAAQGEWEEG